MKASPTALALAGALVLMAAGSSPAGAIRYTVTDLGYPAGVSNDTPDGPFPYTAPQVDNSGTVGVGVGTLQAGPYQVWTEGQTFRYTGPGTPQIEIPADNADLVRINAEDQGHATGVNASGTAVGYLGYLNPQAFVYRPGGPTSPGQSPGVSLIPGTVAGSTAWYALGINSAGDVVGQVPDVAGLRQPLFHGLGNAAGRAFLYDGARTVDLNTLIAPDSGWLLTAATGINDLGQIVGVGIHDGNDVVFLLTPAPTPEPTALLTVLAGVGCLLIRRARKT